MMAQFSQPPLPPLPPPSVHPPPTSFVNYPPPSPILPVYPGGQSAPPPHLGAPFQYVPPSTSGAQFPPQPTINGYPPATASGSNPPMMQSRPYPISAPHSHPMTPAAPMLAQHTGQADYFSPYPYSTPSSVPSTQSQASGHFQPHHHLMTPGTGTIPQTATFAQPHNLGIMIPSSSQPCTPLHEYPSKFGPSSAVSFQSPISPYQPSPSPFGHVHPSYMLSHSVSNPDLSTLPNEIKYHPQAMEYTSTAPPDPYALKRSESGTGLEEHKYLDFGGGVGGAGGPNGQGKRQRVAMACTYCRRRKIRCDGTAPCINCERSGRSCEYVPIPTAESLKSSFHRNKRGPGPIRDAANVFGTSPFSPLDRASPSQFTSAANSRNASVSRAGSSSRAGSGSEGMAEYGFFGNGFSGFSGIAPGDGAGVEEEAEEFAFEAGVGSKRESISVGDGLAPSAFPYNGFGSGGFLQDVNASLIETQTVPSSRPRPRVVTSVSQPNMAAMGEPSSAVSLDMPPISAVSVQAFTPSTASVKHEFFVTPSALTMTTSQEPDRRLGTADSSSSSESNGGLSMGQPASSGRQTSQGAHSFGPTSPPYTPYTHHPGSSEAAAPVIDLSHTPEPPELPFDNMGSQLMMPMNPITPNGTIHQPRPVNRKSVSTFAVPSIHGATSTLAHSPFPTPMTSGIVSASAPVSPHKMGAPLMDGSIQGFEYPHQPVQYGTPAMVKAEPSFAKPGMPPTAGLIGLGIVMPGQDGISGMPGQGIYMDGGRLWQ